MGRSLAPILMTMSQWGQTWMPHESGYRVERVHKACGHAFEPALHCSQCGEVIQPGEIEHVDPARA
jgi:hypothetical protein